MEENKRDQNRRNKETLKKKMKRKPKTRNRVFKRIILVIERNNLINMNTINFNRYRKNFLYFIFKILRKCFFYLE